MGTLITPEKFCAFYEAAHGDYPPLYLNGTKLEIYGYAPGAASMSFFLDNGGILGEKRWKRVTFHVPQAAQVEVQSNLLSLFPEYDGAMYQRFNNRRESVGFCMELLGKHADWQGRPIIEGLVNKRKELTQLHFLRRAVVEKTEMPRNHWGALEMRSRRGTVVTLRQGGQQET